MKASRINDINPNINLKSGYVMLLPIDNLALQLQTSMSGTLNIDWLKLLMADDIPDEIFKNRDPSKAIPPLYGALIKNEQDVQLLERLAFMARREGNTN